MEPWFSIIVPVYNVESYLERCIQSLLGKNFADLEIILVDDGSTDTSGAICDRYSEQYVQITTVHKTNGGLASARNAGLECARGKYIAFVDSDDWMDDNAYKIIYDSICHWTPDILSFGYRKIQSGEVSAQGYAAFPEGYYNEDGIRQQILPDSVAREKAFDQVDLPVQLSACMCVYKRSFLEEHGLRFESERIVLCEDWLFNIICQCRAGSMVILHQILYNYDTRETSLSRSYKPDSYERRQNLYRRYWEELEKTGNLNTKTKHRLHNFWMESVYLCYIIELNSPVWTRENSNRLITLCADERFLEYMKGLDASNCTLKGLIFRMIVRFKLHWFFRVVYKIVRNR